MIKRELGSEEINPSVRHNKTLEQIYLLTNRKT